MLVKLIDILSLSLSLSLSVCVCVLPYISWHYWKDINAFSSARNTHYMLI